jgi:hypothetical protein
MRAAATSQVAVWLFVNFYFHSAELVKVARVEMGRLNLAIAAPAVVSVGPNK